MSERDNGLSTRLTEHPVHLAPPTVETEVEEFVAPLSLRDLLEQHLKRLEEHGQGRSARKSWPPVFEDLLQFLKDRRGLKGSAVTQADDARRLTTIELEAWRDKKLEKLSSKTVNTIWVASVKAVLSRAVKSHKLALNPAAGVTVEVVAAPKVREKGFTDSEALAILRVCTEYVPKPHSNPANRESAHVTSAKRWAPWLCAFSGARVGEVLQLRKSDVRISNGIHYLHLNPEAGTVKGRAFRDVPIHQQLIDIGFLKFVDEAEEGPLFYSDGANPNNLPAQAVGHRLGKWLHELKLIPAGVQPNHGWRHRLFLRQGN